LYLNLINPLLTFIKPLPAQFPSYIAIHLYLYVFSYVLRNCSAIAKGCHGARH